MIWSRNVKFSFYSFQSKLQKHNAKYSKIPFTEMVFYRSYLVPWLITKTQETPDFNILQEEITLRITIE